jgi:outer membrane protein assembly factor BamB
MTISGKVTGMLAAVAASLVLATAVLAADWPQWRGPTSNSVTPEASGWAPGTQPARLWSKNVGQGGSSPIIVDGKVYSMGWQNGNADAVFCFDAKTGEELWKQTYATKYQSRVKKADEGQYGGPSSTPSYDAATGYLYTLSIDGDLKCWDTAKKGAPVWGKNLFDEIKVTKRPDHDYGFTTCPLVLGDTVVVEATAPGGTVTGFDKKTGARRWSSAYNGPAGHTGGPAVMTVAGVEYLVYFTLQNIVVMRADKGHEGQTVGQAPWSTDYGATIPSPTAMGNLFFVTASYNHNETKCFEVTAAGIKEKWRSKASSKISSPVPYKDSVFLVDGALKCVDMATGNVKWQGGKFGLGNCLVAAGDNKIIAFGEGKAVLVDASATAYAELATIEGIVSGTCYPHVALSGGFLCFKDNKGAITCYSTGKGGAAASSSTTKTGSGTTTSTTSASTTTPATTTPATTTPKGAPKK